MNCKDELENLREEISRVTVEILRLCGERLSLARKVGEIKSQQGIPVEDSKVEENLKREVLEKCRVFNVDPAFGMVMLNLLLEESKRVQRELTAPNKNDK